MKNNKVYRFLYNKRKSGDNSYFSTKEITTSLNLPNNPAIFRLMNLLAVKYEVLDVVLEGRYLRRKYRIRETELK